MEAEYRDHPILFSGPMMKAILEGRKTQTRRVIKLPNFDRLICGDPDYDWEFRNKYGVWQNYATGPLILHYCPYGVPGDRLWARETWRCEELESGWDGVRYKADGTFKGIENTAAAADAWGEAYIRGLAEKDGWRPSIFMPRWASRLTLDVLKIRIEKLQDISHEDVIAEGGPFGFSGSSDEDYFGLWDSINGKGSAQKNPWVWAVEFLPCVHQ